MSSHNIIPVSGTLYSPPPTTPSPKAPEPAGQPGFDAKLQAAAAEQPATTTQTTQTSATEETTAPASVAGPQAFGWHFSFFMRIKGDLGDMGQPIQTQFMQASQSVAQTFLGADGWNGDPVGMFLQGADRAIQTGYSTANNYLGGVRQAAQGGIGSMAETLRSWNALGTGSAGQFGFGGLGQSGFSNNNNPLVGNGGFDMARLHISALGQSSATAPTRPLPHNRNGVPLVMVSGPIKAEPKLEVGGAGTVPEGAAVRFLEKFLDLVKVFLKEITSPSQPEQPAVADGTGQTVPEDQPTTETPAAPPDPTVVTNPSDSPDVEPPTTETPEAESADSPVTVA